MQLDVVYCIGVCYKLNYSEKWSRETLIAMSIEKTLLYYPWWYLDTNSITCFSSLLKRLKVGLVVIVAISMKVRMIETFIGFIIKKK